MGIYKGAKRVLIWLGHADPKLASDAKDLALQMAGLWPFRNLLIQVSLRFPFDEALASCDLPKRASPQWNALQKLLKVPYFSRLWVIQEVVVSSDAVLVWGLTETDWRVFKDACYWLQKNNCILASGGKSLDVEALLTMFPIQDSRLESLLSTTTRRQSTEPRDRIFALLGLAKDVDLSKDSFHELKVDYLKPVENLFADATRYIIRQTQTFHVLSYVSHVDLEIPTDWPTWVPQWKDNRQAYTMLQHISDRSDDFTAGADTTVSLEKLPNNKSLILEGLKLGKVDTTIFLECYLLDRTFPSAFITAAWSEVSTRLPDSYMGRPLIHAFLSTLTSGMVLAPGYPLLVHADNSMFSDYVAFAYGLFLSYILDDKLESHSSTGCLRHHLEPAERALDLHQQLVQGHSDSLGQLSGPSDESRSWFGLMMEVCHKDNKQANELGIQLMIKLFRQGGDPTRFYGAFINIECDKRFFTTSKSHMGPGPPSLRTRDIICVMLGGPTPYALRPTQSDEFVFLGNCFLYDFMYGKVITKWKTGELELRDFIIS